MTRSFLTGVVTAALAITVTTAYLATRPTDDRLDEFIFVPILMVLVATAAARFAWRRQPATTVAARSLGATAATLVAMEIVALVRGQWRLGIAAVGASIFVGMFVVGAGLGTWVAVNSIRTHHRPPSEPSLPDR